MKSVLSTNTDNYLFIHFQMTTELEKARKRWKWRIRRCERRRVEGGNRKMRRKKVKRKGSRRKKD